MRGWLRIDRILRDMQWCFSRSLTPVKYESLIGAICRDSQLKYT